MPVKGTIELLSIYDILNIIQFKIFAIDVQFIKFKLSIEIDRKLIKQP